MRARLTKSVLLIASCPIILGTALASTFIYSFYVDRTQPPKLEEPKQDRSYDPLEAYRKSDPNEIDFNMVITGAESKKMYFLNKVSPTIDCIQITDAERAETVTFEIRGSGLFRELDEILEFRDKPLLHFGSHGCRGSANIYFVEKGERSPLMWNFAHGHFFHNELLTPESNARLLDWFESKGFNWFRRQQEFVLNGYRR